MNGKEGRSSRLLLSILAVALSVEPALAQTSTGPGMRSTTQAQRKAARKNAAPQKVGATSTFAGVSAASTGLSPLAAGLAPATMAAPLGTPDYFAVPNWANSPLPTIDANLHVTGGLLKFQNQLPGLCGLSPWTSTNGKVGENNLGQCIPIAKADTTTFPGSDLYKIQVQDYSLQMHSSLPATRLRGYLDLAGGSSTPQYLGPLILATRDRPVRVQFTNGLGLGANGNLFIPMDNTYMGAGEGPLCADGSTPLAADNYRCTTTGGRASYTQNRATLHLHGGNTPWISDGTPHQWTVPAGEATRYPKGVSARDVPDMPATGPGNMSFFWTNQQSGRLMFFHDHAYGITRLNVYAGEAAGYLLVDPGQESALQAATVPGTIVTDAATGAIVSQDLAHLVPLVIQDKTFVPDDGTLPGSQLAATDPTWDVANFGGAGSLWFPHVYMPNQNPYDPTGANPLGRWDYGPWFWPPQPTSVPAVPCTSAAYPGVALTCPGTPNPSGTPEAFMDTPVVNGVAYPSLTVEPAAYRFQILNAANDRTMNLGLYVAEPLTVSVAAPGTGYTAPTIAINGCTGAAASATLDATGGITGITVTTPPTACTPPLTVGITDPTGTGAVAVASAFTEVRMVPAVPATARTLPNCAQANPMGGGGIATALLDAGGLPINGTGLPAGCWPNYTSAQFGAISWPTDARDGGVPDPTTAGPPIIQIGTEGGLLPAPVVIPSTPVSYDYNKRSITVLNVLNHGLLVGPAERADVIVDFSAFAGKTLIFYNDAPAPVPAGDPRSDYYTNGPDNSATGGAPSTLAGYGPNTRTIMQIVVAPTGTASTFSLPALAAALPALFASTQDRIIVPESAYPPGNGNGPDSYVRIQDNFQPTWSGLGVGGLTLTSGGAGYTAAPTVTIAAPPSPCPPGLTCVPATATASIAPTSVGSLALTSGGSGYTSAPTVAISGGGGTGATATAALATRSVASVTVTKQGSGYTSVPTVTFSAPPGGGTTATGTAVVSNRKVTAVTVTNPGSGYVTAPTVTLTGGGGSGAAATAALAPAAVASVNLTAGGSGYGSTPTVTFTGGGGSGAAATAALTPTVVASLTLTAAGSGYTAAPTVTISAPQAAGSTATAVAVPPSNPLVPKTIQELFTLDYGRMNALLGVEMPFTNNLIQTTIPYGYVDPPTEIFRDGDTQFWKITHNGVDTHFIHFHLFNVQVVNRVGWDGAIKPPDPNELSWKDTVRMNPLEDIVVALRPLKQTLPAAWTGGLPNSIRPMDVTMPIGATAPNASFLDVDPTNQPATVVNDPVNFGWEYVWHCHILGHEENDMMRAMALVVPPSAPDTVSALLSGKAILVNWADRSLNETSFSIQRAVVTGGQPGAFTTIGTVGPNVTTYTDPTASKGTTYAYRVVANNEVGYTRTYAAPAVGYPHMTASATSLSSAPVTR